MSGTDLSTRRHRRSWPRLAGAALAAALTSLVVLPAVPAGAVGPTWTVKSSTPPAVIEQEGVACPTTTTCFTTGVTQGGVSVVRQTTDSGSTWTEVAELPPAIVLGSLTCSSALRCVAITFESPALVYTADGWSTWTVENQTGQELLASVRCASSGVCAAAATNDEGEADVLISSDGGAHWTAHAIAAADGGLFGEAATAATCTTATTCIVASYYVKQEGHKLLGVVAFFRTTSAGASWHRVDVPSYVDAINDIDCPTSRQCFATAATSRSGAILASSNAGATWRTVLNWTSIPNLPSLSCVSASVCVVVGTSATGVSAVRTVTAGRTWSRHSVLGGEAIGPIISCASVGRCAVVVAASLALPPGVEVTTDGGSVWAAKDVPTIASVPRAISCPVAGTCEAIGNEVTGTGSAVGYAERTTNSGATWTIQPLPVGIDIGFAINCPSATTCFASALNKSSVEQILTTTNSGTTWTIQTKPSGVESIGSLSCASATVCAGAGADDEGNSIPIYTTNGGTTWSDGALPLAPSGVTYQLGYVTCTSTTVCLGSGDALFNSDFSSVATFFSSTDGGSTWTALSLQGGGEFDSTDLPGVISCTSATTCVSVANSFSESFSGTGWSSVSVFVTTNGGSTWTEEHTIGAQIDDVGNVSCASGGFCEMVGEDAEAGTSYSLTSSDGGVSWTASPMPATWLESIDISCPTSTSCVSLGGTTDGGLGVASFG